MASGYPATVGRRRRTAVTDERGKEPSQAPRRARADADRRDLQHRFTAIESRFSALESRITALEVAVTSRLDAIERRFNVREERMSAMVVLIVRIAERFDRMPAPASG